MHPLETWNIFLGITELWDIRFALDSYKRYHFQRKAMKTKSILEHQNIALI